jgi:hypothetical protein
MAKSNSCLWRIVISPMIPRDSATCYDYAMRNLEVIFILSFGIVAEGLPVGGRGIAAGMRKNVDESFALEWFVGGRPIGHVLYSVLLEEPGGVFAKAPQEVVEFAI